MTTGRWRLAAAGRSGAHGVLNGGVHGHEGTEFRHLHLTHEVARRCRQPHLTTVLLGPGSHLHERLDALLFEQGSGQVEHELIAGSAAYLLNVSAQVVSQRSTDVSGHGDHRGALDGVVVR
jgi:hypothetical protein